MADDSQYSKRACAGNQEQSSNWQSIGDLVARLKARTVAAIEAGDEFEAEISHEELTAAEWRQHQSERLAARRKNRGGGFVG